MEVRTRDLDEAIEIVSRVYCPHSVKVVGRAPEIDVRLAVHRPTTQSVVELSYDAPVEIDAGDFSGLFLMMHCSRGAASTEQGGEHAEWRRGQTMVFSAGLETRLRFDRFFLQRGTRLDMEALEAQCARWLGRPLRQPLRFALRSFSPDLERIWQRSLDFLQSQDGGPLELSPAARASFDEFLLTALLHQHPHNYSEDIAETAATPTPGVVRQAERFMADNAQRPVTVSKVAEHLGISVRSLQAGFRSWRDVTPSAYLRETRLRRVRDDLLRADGADTVTAVAMRYGFAHLGRFSAYYKAAFGEAPNETVRRRRSLRRSKARRERPAIEP
jgi:AraC-like DNA-binding protein